MQVAQRPAPAAVSPLDGEHHEIERPRPLDLQPRLPAPAGGVRAVHRLGHHPFVPALDRAHQKRGGFFGSRRDQARHDPGGGHLLAERRDAARVRLVGERLAVQIQRVEEHRRDGQLLTQPIDVELAAEAPHGHLKRVRGAVGPERDRFAVQDDLARRQPADDVHHFRHGGGHVAEVAREHLHDVARFVHLDARAVQLVLERGFAEFGERGVHVGRRVGQHRLHRLEDLPGEARERRITLDERRSCHRRERAGEHRGAAHAGGGDPRGAGDRFQQHPFERALPQLAKQQANEELLLVARRASEQLAQDRGLRGARSRPRCRNDAPERGVDISEIERLGGRRSHVVRGRHSGAADANAPLPRRSAQVRHGDLDLIRLEALQKRREPVDLLQAAGRLCDRP